MNGFEGIFHYLPIHNYHRGFTFEVIGSGTGFNGDPLQKHYGQGPDQETHPVRPGPAAQIDGHTGGNGTNRDAQDIIKESKSAYLLAAQNACKDKQGKKGYYASDYNY
jgi:hypothetical protein